MKLAGPGMEGHRREIRSAQGGSKRRGRDARWMSKVCEQVEHGQETESIVRRKISDALWINCCCCLQRDAEVRPATGAMEGLLRAALSSEANCLAFGAKHSVSACDRPKMAVLARQRIRSKMARTRSQQPSTSLAADPADISNRGRSRSRSETRVDAKEAVDLVYVTPPPPRLVCTRSTSSKLTSSCLGLLVGSQHRIQGECFPLRTQPHRCVLSASRLGRPNLSSGSPASSPSPR